MCARGGTALAVAPKTMSAHHKPIVHAAPVVDEWGIYDPDRAGLAAVFAKLEAKRTIPSRGDVQSLAMSLREHAELKTQK
jgi:hypothetical protein